MGNIFARAAESCYPEREWRETELSEALTDSRIFSMGLDVIAKKYKGLMAPGCRHRLEAREAAEWEEKAGEEEEADEEYSHAELLHLHRPLEKQYRLEKGNKQEEMRSAAKILASGLFDDDSSDVSKRARPPAPRDAETDDDATIDGDETEVDERYA